MDNDHVYTTQLIKKLEAKDRRFRLVQTSVLLLVAAGVIALLFLNYRLQTQNNKLLTTGVEGLNQLKQNDKNTAASFADLTSHVDCLFKLATTPHTTINPPLIPDPSSCNLTPQTSGSGGASSSPKSTVTLPPPMQATPNTPQSSSSGSSNPTPSPTPNKSFLQKRILQPIMRLINKVGGLI